MDSTTQIYLEFSMADGVPISGESTAGGYENRIDIDGFDFDAGSHKKSLKDALGSDVGSNLDFKSVQVTKVFDRASLQLASAVKSRRKFDEARISIDQQYIDPDGFGKERNEILIFSLKFGYITDLRLNISEGSSSAEIKETLTLTFHNFGVLYYSEKRTEDGKLLDDWRPEPVEFSTTRDIQPG